MQLKNHVSAKHISQVVSVKDIVFEKRSDVSGRFELDQKRAVSALSIVSECT